MREHEETVRRQELYLGYVAAELYGRELPVRQSHVIKTVYWGTARQHR